MPKESEDIVANIDSTQNEGGQQILLGRDSDSFWKLMEEYGLGTEEAIQAEADTLQIGKEMFLQFLWDGLSSDIQPST